ncbi:UDP-4-amino-4,6-dideoxy-N-acetyl-beta-L-altrosamine transaminase [Gammaproteobacteria bacterium]|nr:UDP-4-amino-4,6-dideoxy-N-acetyl-beta-L-altrosamine transaminase [Gammaproteobacteria bacterium]
MILIPYARQSISKADIDAVTEVLQSNYLTQGPVVPEFERALAVRCEAELGVAVNSATSALHLACVALGVGPGDVVWTTPTTFVASANCARYCGADVDFVDIDPNTWCLSVGNLEQKLSAHKKNNLPLPKVVVPVHLSGQSCEMEAISALGRDYGFYILEDASHAIGGSYQGKPVGNCRYSDVTVFSFHPVKIITTGEGGMALTNRTDYYSSMTRLRAHGITRDQEQLTLQSEGSWYYEQLDLGFNYRMNDIQAALGLSQLGRLEEFVTVRNQMAKRYNEAFEDLPIRIQDVPDDVMSARHLYVIRVDASKHREIFMSLREAGIGVNLHYLPVHLHPYYRDLGFTRGQFMEAEKYGNEAISLPLYPSMDGEQQEFVINIVKRLI